MAMVRLTIDIDSKTTNINTDVPSWMKTVADTLSVNKEIKPENVDGDKLAYSIETKLTVDEYKGVKSKLEKLFSDLYGDGKITGAHFEYV